MFGHGSDGCDDGLLSQNQKDGHEKELWPEAEECLCVREWGKA